MRSRIAILCLILLGTISFSGCLDNEEKDTVPHGERWGIYSLDLSSEKSTLIFDCPDHLSSLTLSNDGKKFAFSRFVGGSDQQDEEIAILNLDGSGYRQLTDNDIIDTYPAWSPDDNSLAYLSFRDTMDIYEMSLLGESSTNLLYDSGSHDADIDWVGGKIAFTANSSIWLMNSDGTGPTRLTSPPRAGEWGSVNLPFGDYDPRISPDGSKVVFERLEDDDSAHGNYDIYVVNSDGTGENALTETGYSQGLVSWSHSGDRMIYIVSAIGSEGKFDLYSVNPDGSDNKDITPSYFPPEFLIHSAIFSSDDTKVFFIGEWWV